MRRQLVIFFNQTIQVLDYYRKRHKLRELDGNQRINQVHSMLLKEMNDFRGRETKA